jgi:hypothetical protein
MLTELLRLKSSVLLIIFESFNLFLMPEVRWWSCLVQFVWISCVLPSDTLKLYCSCISHYCFVFWGSWVRTTAHGSAVMSFYLWFFCPSRYRLSYSLMYFEICHDPFLLRALHPLRYSMLYKVCSWTSVVKYRVGIHRMSRHKVTVHEPPVY